MKQQDSWPTNAASQNNTTLFQLDRGYRWGSHNNVTIPTSSCLPLVWVALSSSYQLACMVVYYLLAPPTTADQIGPQRNIPRRPSLPSKQHGAKGHPREDEEIVHLGSQNGGCTPICASWMRRMNEIHRNPSFSIVYLIFRFNPPLLQPCTRQGLDPVVPCFTFSYVCQLER